MGSMQKKIIGQTLMIIFALVAVTTPSNAQDKSWGINATAGFYTDYIFRGKTVYDGTSIQPSVTAFYDLESLGVIGGNVWFQLPGETNEPPEKFREVDYTLFYDFTMDIATLSLGHIWYTFPGEEEGFIETQEFYVGVSADVPLNPSLTFYNDYDEAEYQYYTLRLSESFSFPSVTDELVYRPYVTFAFATSADDGPILYEDEGLVHVDIGIALELQVGDILLVPNFNVTLETDDGATNEFWFGIDVGFDA